MLRRIDDWIAAGVIGGEPAHAARLPDADQPRPA